jgi:hypothetical protein
MPLAFAKDTGFLPMGVAGAARLIVASEQLE